MTDPIKSVFHNVRPEDLPFTIELVDTATDEVVWSTVVTGAGAVLVPGREDHGRERVWARITWPNNVVTEHGKPEGAGR